MRHIYKISSNIGQLKNQDLKSSSRILNRVLNIVKNPKMNFTSFGIYFQKGKFFRQFEVLTGL